MSFPTVRLSRLVDPARPITYGIVQAGEEFLGGVPYIRPTDMTDTSGVRSDVELKRTDPQIARAYRRSTVKAGDIVVSIGPSYGKVMIVPPDLGGANLTQGTARIAPATDVFGRYLYWTLQAQTVRSFWERAVGGATFKALNLEPLARTPCTRPPLEEQRRIAGFLDAETARIDELSDALTRASRVAMERRRVGIHMLVTGATEVGSKRLSNLPWADRIPVSWRTVKINYVARMGSGHTPSRARPEWWTDCHIPWITTGEVSQIRDDRREVLTETREKISCLGVLNSSAKVHPAGTVVLSRTASAGFSAVMGLDMATSQDVVTWTCGPRLDPYYLLWCLRAMRPDLLGRLAFGSTHKTIYVPDLQTLQIPLPPLSEQCDIVARIRASNHRIDELVDKIGRQLQLLAERRLAIITAAVSGQIDVTTARSVAT